MSGVSGIYMKDNNASQLVYYGLYALQHRGQISAGIAVNNNGFIDYHKDLGLLNEIFSKDLLKRLRGNIAVGHVRYAIEGEGKTIGNAQPLVAGYKKGALALVHDGTIVNFQSIKKELEEMGIIFHSDLDTEVIANLITKHHIDNVEEAVIKALDEVKGSYGLVIMTNNSLIGARDPHGIKPLSLGKIGDGYVLSSETCAFDTMGAEFIRDIEPGEIIVIDENGLRSIHKKTSARKLCLFETIYFARPDSKIDGKSIYLNRTNTGRRLANEGKVDADIVIGAPDSGIVAAIGYSEESGIPYAEGLVKNRYVGRTFIELTQELREQGVRIKLNPLKENIEGKRIILVDDSIVRGTTIKRTVKMLKASGAKEVHIRIASPPVINTCYLGMDTPDKDKLISANMTVEDIRKEVGADSLYFISLEGLIEATGGEWNFCTGCFNGEYPVSIDN